MEKARCEGIVLKVMAYREHDLLVDFMTETHGRLTGLARHATKSKKRFGPLLAPANILNVQFKPGELAFLEEVSLAQPLSHLYDQLDRLAAAFYLLDCIRTAVHEGSPDKPCYLLLRKSLVALHERHSPGRVIPLFQYHFLRHLGFQPKLDVCGRCGGHGDDRYYFVFREGQMLCLRCLPQQEPFAMLPSPAILQLRSWEQDEPRWEEEVCPEVKQFLPKFLEYQLGKRLRSSLILPKILAKG